MNQKLKSFAKYSGMAFQFMAYILVGYFIGNWIDGKMNNSTPFFTLFLIVLLGIGGTYKVIKDVLNESSK